MSVQTYTVVSWDPNVRDVEFTDADTMPTALQGLAKFGIYIVTGAPAATPKVWLPSAQILNAIDKTWYENTGTTASPVWSLVPSSGSGITTLTGDVTAGPGSGSQAATIGALKVTGAKMVTGAGYFTVAKSTNGTTPVNVIAATVPFTCTITGVYLISNDTTAGNITLADTAGTVATIAKGATAGAMVGAVSLANTAVTLGDTLTIVSSSAGNAEVFITFTTA